MNFIQTVLAFLLALGPLIVFHELGHYAVARLCGVKVLRFSVGMGKVVWSRRVGADRTEWALSMLPLGGYVKMLDSRDPDAGPIPEADLKREFTRQTVWRRIAIVAAGPLANFLLAIALFAGLYMVGIAEPSTRIRAMDPATPAWQAGLRGDDMVIAVNGNAVASWPDLRWQIMEAAFDQRAALLEVDRPGSGRRSVELAQPVLAKLDLEKDVLGELGIDVARPKPALGEILAGGPAERAGLRSGDLVLAVDGKPVADSIAFVEAIRASGGKPLAIAGTRGGEPFSATVTPVAAPQGQGWMIQAKVDHTPDMVTVASSPLVSLGKAVERTWSTSAMTVKMIGKIVSGEASLKNITGPITIADYAGQTARSGAAVYLQFIAFISISLGVMNLLPIPVLDGGLLLYYSLEVLTGRPLPERVGELAQRLGVGLLVTLMALAVFNDIVRLL